VLEEDDFNQNNQLIGNKVFTDFLDEVGTFAEDMSRLSDSLLEEIGNANSPKASRNISESFNAGFAFSANEAENQLDQLIESFVELRNDQGPEMWLLRFSARENTRSAIRFPYFAKLAFQGRAPREFKYSATILSAQQVFLFTLTRRSLWSRAPGTRIRQGGLTKI